MPLSINDDGLSPGDSSWPEASGTGARIARGLAGQLDATVNVATGPGGTSVIVDFVNTTRTGTDVGGARQIRDD